MNVLNSGSSKCQSCWTNSWFCYCQYASAFVCKKIKWITIFEVHFILSSNETVITGYYQFARHAFNCTTHFFLLFYNYARKCARNGFRIVATNRCSIHVFFRTCMAACRERRGEREMKVTALSSWHSSTQHSCLLAHTASYDDADENLTFFSSPNHHHSSR